MKRLTRTADDMYAVIRSTDLATIAEALGETTDNYVEIYSDPLDVAREYMDTEWIISQYEDSAWRVLNVMQQAIDANPELIIEVDRYSGEVQQTFEDTHALAEALEAIDLDSDDPVAVCTALNDEAMEYGGDVLYICPAVFDKVKRMVLNEAAEAGAADGDWEDNALEFIDDMGIDPDAAYVVKIDGDYRCINCADMDELVDTVIDLAGDNLLAFMAELKRG